MTTPTPSEPSSLSAASGASRASAASEPIEATLEPPEGELDDSSSTRPSRETVIISVQAQKTTRDNASQYMMVRPDRSPPPAHLLVCMGANVGHRYPVGETEVVIGRSDQVDIRLDDDRVSSRHAELVRRGGRYRIYDLGSSNGTLVNAQRIDEIDLRDGDLIQVGYTVFRYVSGDALERQRPAEVQERAPQQPMVQQKSDTQPLQQYDGRNNAIGQHVPQRAHRTVRRDDDDDVSFAEMVSQLRRVINFFWPYRWVITSLTAVGFVAGVISAVAFPSKVAAFFDVRLHSKASENPLEKFEASNVEFFRSATTTFRGTGLITKTLEALGEKGPSPALVQSVQDSLFFVNTGTEPGSVTYTGNYRGPTPERSLGFLQKHVEFYLQAEIDKTLKIIKAQIDFLQSQLDDNEKELRTTEEKLLTFKKQNIDGLPDQARQYYDYLFELQKKEGDLEGEASRLEAEAAVNEKRLSGEKPMVESRSLATRPYQAAIIDVNRQLAEARARGLAENHPDVQQLKAKLVELKSLAKDAESSNESGDVERSRNPAFDSTSDRLSLIRSQAAAARQERTRIREDQERIKGIVDKLPKLEAEYADLTRSYDATKQLHTRIFDQLKTAQLQYELEKASASARYEIITAPRLEYISPVKTIGKRAGLLAVVGVVIGFLFAAVMQMRKLIIPALSQPTARR